MPRSVGTAEEAANCSKIASAWGSRRAVGATAPAAMRPAPVSVSTATATEQVAMTIAFRVPTFAKRLRHARRGRRTATISSSSRSDVRPGDTSSSLTGILRAPLAPATSTSPSWTSSAGRLSPAGLAVARLPPSVARARICGEPTVTTAPARAARSGRRVGDVGHGVRGTDPDAAVVPVDALELCDGGEVKYPGELGATEVHLDHEVGSAGDRVEFGSRARTSTASERVVGRMALTRPKGYVQLRAGGRVQGL